ncbi:MAG TPA: hypothetical protein VG347_20070 [Verrucomicrobiae bacterium]|nr:hypothetical protein [Verrucomicrobiae bacterium]
MGRMQTNVPNQTNKKALFMTAPGLFTPCQASRVNTLAPWA